MTKSAKATSDSKAVLTTQRDVPLLHFLWRWKVSTTSALAAHFFPNRTLWTAYKRLWSLERAGYIRARTDDTATDYLWTLDKKGFAFVLSQMPEMREEGYLSENLKHDTIVSAIHLGDGLLGDIQGLKYFSEQELRRHEYRNFPTWVPQSDWHRPDGYWLAGIEDGQRLIALEVELSTKGDSDYEKIGRFYDDHTEIHRVIWVVEKDSFAEKIHRLMKKVSRKESKHCFVLLEFIYRSGWQAQVFLGPDTGKSIASILGKCPPTGPQPVGAQLILDTRKTPHKSKHCQLLRNPSFSH